MNCEYAVKVEKLVKAFKGVEVIKDCDMNVKKGQIYGLLGANGAGKTTVFKILAGLLTPTAGKAEVLGRDVSVSREEILRNIGSLIEVPVFYEHLSAAANLELHLAYIGVQGVDIYKTLELVGLTDTGTTAVSKLSLGMRQRLGIARAVIHKPELLILDEPINGLDPMGIRKMRELFVTLIKEYGMTILLSSHILSEIELIADTAGIIVNGEVVQEIELSKVKEQYQEGLEEYFLKVISGGDGVCLS